MSNNTLCIPSSQHRQTAKLQRIPVFYTPQMVADADSFSPSALKPAAVVESWLELGIPMNIIAPAPATADDIGRAHLPAYVEAVLSCKVPNGFGNCSEAVAKSLPFTNGAMLAAARAAICNGRVAVAPCSGFHHAGYAHGAGFCTFNGLMVTAMTLYASGKVSRVGILDFDQHYGDGTDQIMSRLSLDWVKHFSAGQHCHFPVQADSFLASIPDLVAGMKDCDVILYQAGADPHIDDPLGGWLTTTQLHERDQLVFEAAAKFGIPVAWNLAGGYQTPLRKVLEIHDGTMRACSVIHSDT